MSADRSGRARSRWRGRALMLLPFALVMVIGAADLVNGPQVHLGPLLSVATATTACFAGPGEVAVIGLVAVTAYVIVGVSETWRGVGEYEMQLSSLIMIMGVMMFVSTLRQRHRRELTLVRSVAETAQRVLMRPLPARVGPLRIASLYLTAEQEARIGGDLYGAARIARGTRLIIGDVRGKGLAAVDTAALVVGAFWAAAHQRSALRDLLAFLDGAAAVDPVPADGGGPGWGERFVTAAVLDVPDEKPCVHVVNRGHPPPLLLAHGEVTELIATRPAPPLGLGDLAPEDALVDTFPFGPGDVLFLYTDGVIEARAADGAFYPLQERLRMLDEHDPGRLVERLHADLCAYTDEMLNDDVAIIAIKRTPA
ncbi:PP2C family protein-serine/threonine phosphatase [Actinoallomurus soli]|uniref:PP2C family protein-serine/threonine phosphatase n=1 Tax=Actinoallomurus soli TaxID=2952535 RepID=UPI00209241A9|nr:PP2C family protein-serine/threonine phosphatase [Actinoallomurus soli]MCO5972719.1 serine/threonine-protein phosphatase [Actinoallomurus soli]